MAVLKKLFFAITLVLSGTMALRAQTASAEWLFGAFGSLAMEIPQGNFSNLPGVFKGTRTGDYSRSEVQTGYSAGFVLLRPVASWLNIAARIDFQNGKARFSARESITYIAPNGDPAIAVNQYTLTADSYSVGIQPELHFPFFKDFALIAGARLGFPVSSFFTQSEQFTEPSDFTFTDPQEDISGELPNLSNPVISLVGGIVAPPLPLFKVLEIRPDINAQLALTQMLESDSWQNFSIRGGISIFYAPQQEPLTFLRDTVFQRDTLLTLGAGSSGKITLLKSVAETASDTTERIVTQRTTVYESYERMIPQPEPILSAQVEAQIFHGATRISSQTVPGRRVIRCRPVPLAGIGSSDISCDTVFVLDSIRVRFLTDIISENEIRQWGLRVFNDPYRNLWVENGIGNVGEVNWKPEILKEGEISFNLFVEDSKGHTIRTEAGKIKLFSPVNTVTHIQHVYNLAVQPDEKIFFELHKTLLGRIALHVQPECRIVLKAPDLRLCKRLAIALKIPQTRIITQIEPGMKDLSIIIENPL